MILMKDACTILRLNVPEGAPQGVNDENDPVWSFSSEGATCKRGRPLTCDFYKLPFHRAGENSLFRLSLISPIGIAEF